MDHAAPLPTPSEPSLPEHSAMNGLRMAGLAAAIAAAIGVAAIGAGAFGIFAGGAPRPVPRGAVGGATYSPVNRARHHALVVTSLKTGGAEVAAGLKVGDMVEAVDGRADPSLVTLRQAETRRGPTVMKVQRNGDVVTLTLLQEAAGGPF